MIDPEVASQFYDASIKEWGRPLTFAVFDRRVLVPLEELGEFVRRETGRDVPDSTLAACVNEGLIPVLPGAGVNGDERGFPLYAPSRVGLFLDLMESGYSTAELKKFAEFEEAMIDCVLTVDDLAYEDDDVQLLLNHYEEQADSFSCHLRFLRDPAAAQEAALDCEAEITESEEQLKSARAAIAWLNGLSPDRLSSERREHLARAAFQVRMLNELIRNNSLETDRAKMRAGYSPWVMFERQSTSWTEGRAVHSFQRVMWRATVSDACVLDDEDHVGLRLPGLRLVGDRVTLTDGVSPSEYERLWREHDLDGYFRARAEVTGQRICLHCLRSLPNDASKQKRYCGELCRQAAKQKRFRERHPDRVIAIQERYWSAGSGSEEE